MKVFFLANKMDDAFALLPHIDATWYTTPYGSSKFLTIAIGWLMWAVSINFERKNFKEDEQIS